MNCIYDYKYLIHNNKLLSWFSWYDNYKNTLVDYIPLDKYKYFSKHYYNLIKEIEDTLYNNYYKLSDEYTIYNRTCDGLNYNTGFYYSVCDSYGPIFNYYVLYSFARLAKKYNRTLLEIFILTFMKYTLHKCTITYAIPKPDEYIKIDSDIHKILYNGFPDYSSFFTNISIDYSNKYTLLQHKIDYDICDETNINILLDMCRYYLAYININFLIDGYNIFSQTVNYRHIDIKVKKYDNNVLNNIIHILNVGTDNEKVWFFNDILKTAKMHCISPSNVFIMLITKDPYVFNNIYDRNVGHLKQKYGVNYNRKEPNVEIKAKINAETGKNSIKDTDISIYNIQIADKPVIKTNSLYYIKRDKFNINYKRIYKCLYIISSMDIAIMTDITPDKIQSQKYVLTENDCSWLNIGYEPDMEVFSIRLNWIEDKGIDSI